MKDVVFEMFVEKWIKVGYVEMEIRAIEGKDNE